MSGEPRPRRALLHVQHLLGVGHLARAARLATALSAAGIETTMAMGGLGPMPFAIGGAELVRLPGIGCDHADLSHLLDEAGRPLDESFRRGRVARTLALLEAIGPDLLITEAFPFGRRALAFEMLPLLAKAREQTGRIIACSIRDLLQETRKPGRAEETVATLCRWYDLVLVHGDETVTPLALTFPLAGEISDMTRYTGLIGPARRERGPLRHDLVVSAGGGAVGRALIASAARAARLLPPPDLPWLLLPGLDGSEPAPAGDLPDFVKVSPFVPDLAGLLARARVSVSQAGYNTVADIAAAGVPAVLVPFAAGGETEQARRADLLAAAGRAVMLREADLSPDALLAAIAAARRLVPPQSPAAAGADRAAALLVAAWQEKYRKLP
jgi:predicted glycosyltransferase